MDSFVERYDELYDIMASSSDRRKMEIFGDAEKWIFEKIAKSSPDVAKAWLERLEGVKWCNYLSENEASGIMAHFINQDGSKGPKWSASQIESAVRSAGGDIEDEPHYNKFALVAVMNMIASDHWKSLASVVPDADMPVIIYKMAVEKLKDPDRKNFVHDYFQE